MLVLTRKIDEKIDIMDGLIIINVVQVRGKQVRLGFICAPEIKIERAEQPKELRDARQGRINARRKQTIGNGS